jgi:hypothetical protein
VSNVIPFIEHSLHLGFFALLLCGLCCFSGGFTLSTSAITSLNGRGMCGIGLEFVVFSFQRPASLPYLHDKFGQRYATNPTLGAHTWNLPIGSLFAFVRDYNIVFSFS